MKPVTSAASAVLIATATLLASAAASANDHPALHPNANLHHLRNASAATGRAGSASLAVRAFLGQDGKTTVDVTTGTLDSPEAAPGNIKKVQLKGFNGDGDVAWSKSYSDLSQGGSLVLSLDGLHRGQPVQTQGNITGINGNRTDVVTVTGNVKLRPDPAVEYVWAPPQAPAGMPVNVVALIHETNGDAGATGDCILLVDGVPVDRANGIYVDSGTYVSCAFTHSFDTAGTHALEVRLTDVVPGDWDTSNNAATGSVDIVSGNTVFWYANASKGFSTSTETSEGWYRYSDGTYASGGDWKAEGGSMGEAEMFVFSGYAPTTVSFPLSQLTMQVAADGAVFSSVDLQDVPANDGWNDGNDEFIEFYRYDPATDLRLFVRTSPSYASGATWISAERYAGKTTFFSRSHSTTWYDHDGGTEYFHVENEDRRDGWGYGSMWPMTSTVTVDFTLVDANGETLQANAEVPLSLSQYEYSNPPICQEYSVDGYVGRNCYTPYHQEGWMLAGAEYGVD
jgi:hypothetical protein